MRVSNLLFPNLPKEYNMPNKNILTLTTAIAMLVPALAHAGVSLGDRVGVEEAEIRANLEKAGYKVKEFEFEDGEIEVEAVLDGQEIEIEISPSTGKVAGLELEDDDHHKDECKDG